jgi:hypothetical protein
MCLFRDKVNSLRLEWNERGHKEVGMYRTGLYRARTKHTGTFILLVPYSCWHLWYVCNDAFLLLAGAEADDFRPWWWQQKGKKTLYFLVIHKKNLLKHKLCYGSQAIGSAVVSLSETGLTGTRDLEVSHKKIWKFLIFITWLVKKTTKSNYVAQIKWTTLE